MLRKLARRLVYEFDDVVCLRDNGETDNRRFRRFARIVKAADLTVCGNRYLAKRAESAGARSTVVVPTAIDTDRFCPPASTTQPTPQENKDSRLLVCWTGSTPTNRYLREWLPTLAKLRHRIRLRVVSDSLEGLESAREYGLDLSFVPWSPETEVRAVQECQAGIMPLPDNPWTQGKCGLKLLQYMSIGLPAVCSPVGVNKEIVDHEQTGLLAETTEEWLNALQRLADSPQLRKRLGTAAREKVLRKYALNKVAVELAKQLEWSAEQGQYSKCRTADTGESSGAKVCPAS